MGRGQFHGTVAVECDVIVAEMLSFATKSPVLIFQEKICRKSRVQKSNLCDRLLRHFAARNPGRCERGAGFRRFAPTSHFQMRVHGELH